MLLVIRGLMFLACLVYGMMPGMAADMSVPLMGSQVSDHSDHAVARAPANAKDQSDPCPHRGSVTHAPFCAACLVLLPAMTFAEKGASFHAAPLPEVQAAFIGSQLAPPLPPPRV